MKFLAFLIGYIIPIVMRKPPIQKNVSTAKYAAGTIVGMPGVVRMSMVYIQFLIFMNLNHISCPNTIQKIDSTLAPFKNSKFSFSVDEEKLNIFGRLVANENDVSTLTGTD